MLEMSVVQCAGACMRINCFGFSFSPAGEGECRLQLTKCDVSFNDRLGTDYYTFS